jgi:hypothetical protein
MPSAKAVLPRALRGPLAAGVWASALACTWQLAASYPGDLGTSEASVQDQRFAASIWMLHLTAWCWLACRRLSLRRAAASRMAG